MTATSATSPGTARSDTTLGGAVAWSNPTNVAASDNSRATAALNNQTSEALYAFDFNFAIPGHATIDGITVAVEKSRTAGTGTLIDNLIRLVRAGRIQASGDNKASSTAWTGSDATTTYGASDDVWGWDWTPADINSPQFGVIIAAQETASLAATAGIDHITVTVTYTDGYSSTPQVQTAGEVFLFGRRYRLAPDKNGKSGTVKETLATQFPNKIVTNQDYDRSSNPRVSSYNWSDLRGGMGRWRIRDLVNDNHFFWTSENMNTLWPNLITLAPLATSTGTPSHSGTPNTSVVTSIAPFRANIVAVWGSTDVHVYDGSAWTTTRIGQLTSVPLENATLFNGRLFYPRGASGYSYHSGITSGTFGLAESSTPTMYTFCVWDNKIFGLDVTTGVLYHSTTGDVGSWTTAAAIPGIDASATALNGKLVVDDDAAGEPIVKCVNNTGLWSYDWTADKWYASRFQTPYFRPWRANQTEFAAVWRESLYAKTGIRELTKLTQGSGALSVERIPLAPDDVTLTQMQEFVDLEATNNLLYALLGADVLDISYGATGQVMLAAYNGIGWHPLYVSSVSQVSTVPRRCRSSGEVGSSYLLFFGDFNVTSSLPTISIGQLETNPLYNLFGTYAASGFVELPVFDGGVAERVKVAEAVRLQVIGATANETVTVSYRLNSSTGAYTTLGSAVTVDDEVTISFGTNFTGVEFKAIQFRLSFARGSTTTLAPKLDHFTFDYRQKLEVQRGFNITIDLRNEAYGRTPHQQYAALSAAMKATQFGTFAWRDDANNVRSCLVEVLRPEGAFETGADEGGQMTLTLMEVGPN